MRLPAICLLLPLLLPAAPVSAEQEARWRSAMHGALTVPDSLPPLDARTHSTFEPAPGVVAERVTYGTQFGMRIPAVMYLPKERKTRGAAFQPDPPRHGGATPLYKLLRNQHAHIT